MLVESFEHAGLTVEIHVDEDSSYANPRDNDGILGYIISGGAGREYGIGEEQRTDGFDLTEECSTCEGSGEIETDQLEGTEQQPDDQPGVTDCPNCEGTGIRERSLKEYFREEHDSRVVLPLFLLDHSGLRLSWGTDIMLTDDEQAATRSTNRFIGDEQGWDTSFIGFAFDTAETRKACGCDDWDADRIRESIEVELDEYGKFIAGEVYGYVIKNGDEVIDSLWGMIGWDYVEQEAKEEAERSAQAVEREKREADYWLAREVTTVD